MRTKFFSCLISFFYFLSYPAVADNGNITKLLHGVIDTYSTPDRSTLKESGVKNIQLPIAILEVQSDFVKVKIGGESVWVLRSDIETDSPSEISHFSDKSTVPLGTSGIGDGKKDSSGDDDD